MIIVNTVDWKTISIPLTGQHIHTHMSPRLKPESGAGQEKEEEEEDKKQNNIGRRYEITIRSTHTNAE